MVNNRESYCYVIGGLLIRSTNMVFHGVIDGSLKVYILYAFKDKEHKPQELSEKLGVSLATFFKIKKEGFESLKTKKMRARPGRPVMIDTGMERLLI